MDVYYDWSQDLTMKWIAAAKFKESCLALLDQVDADGIVITKHGKPVAKLIPYGAEPAPLIGSLAKKIRVKGDISSTKVLLKSRQIPLVR
jgi:prevent-host-death family protein